VDGVSNTDLKKTPDNGSESTEPYISNRVFTIPNLICWFRLGGSFVLVGIAVQGNNQVFLWLFLILAMSDWVDGKLAILLNQRSVFGARLDSWADAALYAALTIGATILYGPTLRSQLLWIIVAVASYVVSTSAGFLKYQRWPSYHTRAAKTSWFLIILGAIGLFSDWSLWPLRIALVVITLTNIEAILITIISPAWRADVTSIYHAWKHNKSSSPPNL
jgi:cardiolipin synthase